MIALIDVNICPLLPQQFIDTCKAEVPIVVAEIMASIDQSVSSNDICTSLGACSTTPLLTTITNNNEEEGKEEGKEKRPITTTTTTTATLSTTEAVECPLCHIVITTLIMRMKDPETRKNIADQARDACKQLPDVERVDKCMADVDELFNSIDALLEDVDVGAACRVLEFCDDDDDDKEMKRKKREGVKQLKHLASLLISMTPSTTTARRSDENEDDENCETCKTIVMEAAAVLTNPETQQEVMEYAKQACSVMEEYKEQCEQYVQLYGPLVFTMAVSYLQPGPLCERLGYCDGVMMMMMMGEVVV
jgi:saposin